MRTTPYGEPSSKEIDALRQPPICPQCGHPTDDYGELCQDCSLNPPDPLEKSVIPASPP